MQDQAPKTPRLRVGFRFVPEPGDLAEGYLRPRVLEGIGAPAYLIRECDVYQHDPWDLFQMHHPFFKYTDDNIYFFSPRHHAGGSSSSSRPVCRIAGSGVWAGQAKDELIKKDGRVIGHKTQLTFKKLDGKKKKAIKTDWLMHEFRLGDGGKFDEVVLCRIHEKKSAACRQQAVEDHHRMLLARQQTMLVEDDDHQNEMTPALSSSPAAELELDDEEEYFYDYDAAAPLLTPHELDSLFQTPLEDDHHMLAPLPPALLLPGSTSSSWPPPAPLLTPQELDSHFQAASPWPDQFGPNYYTTTLNPCDYFGADVA